MAWSWRGAFRGQPKELASAKPQRERGYAATSTGTSWWDDLTNEPEPELRWPLSVAVFDRMRKSDAQVASVLRAVTSPIIRTQWWVDGTGVDPVVTEFVAKNLGLPIKGQSPDVDFEAPLRGRDRFSWNDHLRHALLMLPFGHSYFEQLYRLNDQDGLFWLRKLGPRLPTSVAQVRTAADGGLVSIVQKPPVLLAGVSTPSLGTDGPEIPASRLVAYVMDREGGNWLGTSLLRPAYKNWLLKDRALRKWYEAIERQASGLPVYTGAETEEDLETGEEVAAAAAAGIGAGLAIPHGATLELKGVEGSLPKPEEFVRYQDEQIARAVLAHFLNLGTQTGSWALGSTFADFFTLSLQAVAEEVRDTASRHIVEDLVDINFGPTVPAPVIAFDEIGTRASELDRVREMAGLQSDADLVKFLRAAAGGGLPTGGN